eukprot:gene30472-36831_t
MRYLPSLSKLNPQGPSIATSMPPLRSLPFPELHTQLIQASVLNLLPGFLLLFTNQRVLTKSGLMHATALGWGLWTFLGPAGWTMGAAYLILGYIVTKIRMKEKERLGIAEKRGGARGPENVWGSAATPLGLALLTPVVPGALVHHLKIAFVTAWCTKLGDTFSSEIGKAYGKNAFLATSWQRVKPGTEGAVSLEGCGAGVLGISVLACLGHTLALLKTPGSRANARVVGVVVVSAVIANAMESYMGAILQGGNSTHNKELLSNEMVNLLMTLMGAGLSLGFCRLLRI